MKSNFQILMGFVLISFSFSGCFPDECGLFGYTSTYSTKFVLDKEFENLQVPVGDTLIFRPETHAHVNFFYTGSYNCEGEDYKDAPDFNVRSEYDSIATAQTFYDYDSDPLWLNSELKMQLIGNNIGITTLNIEATWHQATTTEDFIHHKNFEIYLEVIAN